MFLTETLYLLSTYIIGCFCGAYYYGKIFKKIDLREHGSGNLGARNTGRVLGKKAFAIVFLVDFAKGLLVIGLGKYLDVPDIVLLGGMYGVVIGHMFPIQLKFRGGIGIASYAGAIVALNGYYALILIAIFAIAYSIFRTFSRSGFIAMWGLPVVVLMLGFPEKIIESIALLVLAAVIRIKHQ